jgi:MFS superfamily sulfate permease-like transporter
MQIRVVALSDGTIQIFGDEGPFEAARQATERLLALLAEQGVPVELVGAVEQHRADVEHVHLQEEVRRDQ